MSFPNSPNMIGSPNSNNSRQPSKSKLRNVRLELPTSDYPRRMSPASPQFPPPAAQTNSFTGQISPSMSSPRVHIQNPAIPTNVTLMSPTIFYSFPENCTPAIVLDVLTPNSVLPFSVDPSNSLSKPRFLIYTVCSTSISTSPVKFILNGNVFYHWTTDPQPLDVTDQLVPFGQQNWLIVESGNFIVPFTVVGVWASYTPLPEIISQIETFERFEFNEVAAICPITGMQIEIPAKGIRCNHEQCFDIVPYISTCLALGSWTCPICSEPLPIDELRIGTRSSFLDQTSNVNVDQNMWQDTQQAPFFEESSAFWNQ